MANLIACSAPRAGKAPAHVSVNIAANAAVARKCNFFTMIPP
jgi:hypothetical protein